MTGYPSALFDLRLDQRPFRLADRMVIFSGGIGSLWFLLSCGYRLVIHDVLFVPLLTTNLFSANKVAMELKSTYFKVLEYPETRWINRHASSIEFTATIRSNNLAYMNWRVDTAFKSARGTMDELHACLNHTPHPVLREVNRNRSIDGLPVHVSGPRPHFCEDSINGELTRTSHSKLAARAGEPQARVFTHMQWPVAHPKPTR